ncbi:hypothetical protein Q4S27_07975 [Morganella morganii subsp. sibonii]
MEIILIIAGVVAIVALLIMKRKKSKKAADFKILNSINSCLKQSGFELTPHGAAVSLMLTNNGYTAGDAFSYIAVVTAAQHFDNHRDVDTLLVLSKACVTLSITLKLMNDAGYLSNGVFDDDISALSGLMNVDSDTNFWVNKILSENEFANTSAVAVLIDQ